MPQAPVPGIRRRLECGLPLEVEPLSNPVDGALALQDEIERDDMGTQEKSEGGYGGGLGALGERLTDRLDRSHARGVEGGEGLGQGHRVSEGDSEVPVHGLQLTPFRTRAAAFRSRGQLTEGWFSLVANHGDAAGKLVAVAGLEPATQGL